MYIKCPDIFGFPCLNVKVKIPIRYHAVWKKNHKYFISAGCYFAKYEITIIISDAFVLRPGTANAKRTKRKNTT